MNLSWLQQVQTENTKNALIGRQVEILECQHVDIRPGQLGTVVGTHDGVDKRGKPYAGYMVETTGIFAKDVQNCQQETRTETVFVEANRLKLVELKEANEI